MPVFSNETLFSVNALKLDEKLKHALHIGRIGLSKPNISLSNSHTKLSVIMQISSEVFRPPR